MKTTATQHHSIRPAHPTTVSRRVAAATLSAALVLAGLALLIAGLISGGTGRASADARCDAYRAQYGPLWPCIPSDPHTVTPTPYQPTTAPAGPTDGSGVHMGVDVGPGPGPGNGTPIVPVPGSPPAPGQPPTDGKPVAPAPIPSIPATAGAPTQAPQHPAPPTQAPTPPPELQHVHATAPHTAEPATTSDGTSPMTTGLLTAASAGLVVGATWRLRLQRHQAPAIVGGGEPPVPSLLPAGGSERGRVGNSNVVLINDPASPKTYTFDEHVPPGGHIRINPDGSATVLDADGNPVRQIDKPWAYDSLGRPQMTWYTVDSDGTLVQHVQPADDALYPILADPTIGACTPSDPDGNGVPGEQPPSQQTQQLMAQSNAQALSDKSLVQPTGPYTQDEQAINERNQARAGGLGAVSGTASDGTPMNVYVDPSTGQASAQATGQSPATQQAVAQSNAQAFDDQLSVPPTGPYTRDEQAAIDRNQARSAGLAATSGMTADGTRVNQYTDPSTGRSVDQPIDPAQATQNAMQQSNWQGLQDQQGIPPTGPYTPEEQQAVTRQQLRAGGLSVVRGTAPDGSPTNIITDPSTGRTIEATDNELEENPYAGPAETLGSGLMQGGTRTLEEINPQGRHGIPVVGAEEAERLERAGKLVGRIGVVSDAAIAGIDAYNDYADGKATGYEAAGEGAGAFAGGWLGAETGAAIGAPLGPAGIVIGMGVGALAGSTLGKKLGKSLGNAGGTALKTIGGWFD